MTEALNNKWNWELAFSSNLNPKLFHCEENAKRNIKPTLVKGKFGKQATRSDIIIWKVQAPWKEIRPHAFVSASRPTENFVRNVNF